MNCNKDRDVKRYIVCEYADFMDFIRDERDALQSFIDDLDDDWDAFQKFYLTEGDLRGFNDILYHTKPSRRHCKK